MELMLRDPLVQMFIYKRSCLCADHGGHPPRRGTMGEVHSWAIYLPDRWELHQRTVRPDWHRDHHHHLRAVRLFRHLQGEPMDAQTGENIKHALKPQIPTWSWSISLLDDLKHSLDTVVLKQRFEAQSVQVTTLQQTELYRLKKWFTVTHGNHRFPRS